MQTNFSAQQLLDPDLHESEQILRKCIHCGFCNATCPTFQLTGDELDGPRGRIYLIKDMLESSTDAGDAVVKHIDRCLSCLGCMTTCPSGVDYMHLVDYARSRIEAQGTGSTLRRVMRRVLGRILSSPGLHRNLFPLARLLSRINAAAVPRQFRHLISLLRSADPGRHAPLLGHYPAPAPRRGSVALLPGCVQQTLDNEINHATVRLLNRMGYDVKILGTASCCGAIQHHLGEREPVLGRVRENVRAWSRVLQESNCEALILNASGCGTMIKDYGHLLAGEPEHAAAAGGLSRAAADISEFLLRKKEFLPAPVSGPRPVVAFQNPCSMEHGQRLKTESPALLRHYGLRVEELPANSGCCGSAGTYNMLQPEFARQLGQIKARDLQQTKAVVIASGNLGCILQLRQYLSIPIVHTVRLLDWMSGGPMPAIVKRGDS